MAPTLLFDISGIDWSKDLYDTAAIEAVNPHRGAMRLLDGIVYESDDKVDYVAYYDIGEDEFWVEGHIPGRPIFPGVLMIEAAAQLSSFITLQKMTGESFMGFAGVDAVKFRGQVKPGDRLVILIHETEHRRRRCTCLAQGLVDGNLVFEATIKGMPM
ncbi:3-hydroxyacyl-ACP dehydratase FabZ family protein [Algisphaera agarilytica]|uniref:3-hydroxyacyl-[acyl-carrier-protein] dehydratase n=1 Tax=Algisphaera agarilytica TaxID=1385975 RepID=A0A7X0H353_9BACT|nr:3-hydroxyacyl-ACP dehydratase FabZ family protein [Algisphaera agarilytica]MBB6428427.1 3-hydroxyacyl-[acyl-carrier-protein] dehydratase [Algisphaera agarilytica]